MKPKEYSYYNIDVGFFPRCVKLCFNNDQFQEILQDQKMTGHAVTALEVGVAETHYIGEGKKGIIVAVFNIDDMTSLDEMIATIAHETVHIIERISNYIEEEEMFSEETRAYLTESIVRQIFKACIIERENHARKTPRAILQKIGRKIGGSDVQVDKHGDGGARQDSVPKRESAPRGAKGKVGKTIAKTDNNISAPRKTRVRGHGNI
jgi:hypothetical protein